MLCLVPVEEVVFHVASLIGQNSNARYFKEHGWPTSTVFATPPESDADRSKLIDILQVPVLSIFCSLYSNVVSF